LGLVDGKDALDCLGFEQDGLIDDNVGPESPVDSNIFMDGRKRDFDFEGRAVVLAFPA
jgi:hypothetical protein